MFYYILKKEFLLIIRNLHALIVLFVMPTVFIIIMSLALQNTYANKYDVKLSVLLSSEKTSPALESFVQTLNDNTFFTFTLAQTAPIVDEALYHQKYDFVLTLSNDFNEKLGRSSDVSMALFSRSDISYQQVAFLKQFLSAKLSESVIKNLLEVQGKSQNALNFDEIISHTYVLKDKNATTITSVQHSVPSWLIFSMFFILIPISNTFINEKNFGTIDKIRSINVSLSKIIMGKFIPYFVMNQLQVFCMILVGMYLIPLLNGDALIIHGSLFLLILISCIVSIAAISFALFIATLSNSSEMATILGGTSNIILAALGGIMVPKVVMPKFMQDVSEISPMSWALDGFLDIIVKGGNFGDIELNVMKLLLFALLFFTLACLMLNYRRN
ncbi:ABC transporter permease [Sulfurospirillum arsenophilum]|uniref:ABC transporter permease n=1 Tax=Sulfurospirillum arsenophilum TaxID=56698 RepID=UPI0005A79EA9|nr:ABC transporter permease [Sulfurospirillum arsenophilum]